MASSPDLCSDMIYEILTRTSSIQTLDTCKAVRKDWKELIYEPNFMPAYCQTTKNLSGYYVQGFMPHSYVSKFASINHTQQKGSFPPQPSVESLPKDMQILASSNQGILCCSKRKYRHLRYYVCKPSTNQWKAMPNPKTRYQTVSVGLVVVRSNPFHFKVVRISIPRYNRSWEHEHYRTEIFYSKTWAWKEANDVVLPRDVFLDTRTAVTASGSIYWLTSDDNVMAFSVDQECFTTIPLPDPVRENEAYKPKRLMEYQGKLGFCCMFDQETMERCLELWVLENGKSGHPWKKEKTLDLSCVDEEEPCSSVAGLYNADIAFVKA